MWTDKLGGNGQCPFRLGSFEAGLSIADQREIEGLTTAGLLDDRCCPPRRWLGGSKPTFKPVPVRRNLNASGATLEESLRSMIISSPYHGRRADPGWSTLKAS